MISKILQIGRRLLFGSNNQDQIQHVADLPPVIDLTGLQSQGGCSLEAQQDNSKKRKYKESDPQFAGLKRRRLAMDNSDDEEDIQIIPQPAATSPLQEFWNWVLPKSSKTTQKQKGVQQAVSKSDLNTKEVELVKEVSLGGATFQAAPPTKLRTAEPEEVQTIKVVNPNKAELIDLTESQDNDTPTTTTVSSSVASSEASVQLDDNGAQDSEVEYLRQIPGSSGSRPSQRFRVTTTKERQKQSFDSLPVNLRAQLKSGKKSSLSGNVFRPKQSAYINMKARDRYQSLILPMFSDNNPWTRSLGRLRPYDSSIFSQTLRPFNTSVVRQAQNEIINIKDEDDNEISVIDQLDSAGPSKPVPKTPLGSLFKTPFSAGSPTTLPGPTSLFRSSASSPSAALSTSPKDIIIHSTPFLQKSVEKEKKPLIETTRTFSRSSSLTDEFQKEDVYSKAFLKTLKEKYGYNSRERERKIIEEKLKNEILCKKREELDETLNERVERYMKITDVMLEEPKDEDDEESTELPEITPDMDQVIQRAYRTRGTEKLVHEYKIEICGKDIDTLKGLNWLNDEVINFYMQMIVARGAREDNKYPKVFAYNTFFYSTYKDNGYSRVRRWTKKEDIFSYDLLLVPVHLGMHWCLATIDVANKSINYYDSMNGNNQTCVDLLKRYLTEEHQDKKKSPMDLTGWKQEIKKDIPQQMNGSDCGMFTCKFAEYLARRAKITFSQQDMPYFRRRMVYEIVKNDLMKP